MKHVLETTQLEFDKSSFLVDLAQHDTGNLYIEISQTIKDGNKSAQTIKINPTVLPNLLLVLQEY